MAGVPQAAHDAEIAALKAQIKELEDLLGLHDDNLGVVFRLPVSLTKLMGLLMSVPNVTPDMIQQRLMIATDAKVAIHRLRTHLEEWQVEIRSRRALGYWFDDETKKKIRAIVTSKVAPGLGAPSGQVTTQSTPPSLQVPRAA